MAKLCLGETGPLSPEAWVSRAIASGGQYLADGAEVRIYGTEGVRTLELVATNPLSDQRTEMTEERSPTTAEVTTDREGR